ncbi:sensor histidine kinase [Agromyces seonyuensis]|uniref:histidine kinase n=1 Tax=Agromyces seonyuensis TaxID=2662446 RepID=A0A6I4NT06_9MICO|nr:sensor domain-containing protein [Agromyces seonyuensis]MWB97353.1 hypothetical protein [Agromyces seonyuensis]
MVDTTAAPGGAAAAVPAAGRERRGYARAWAGVPGHLGYLLPTLPIAVVSAVVIWTLFWTGWGLFVLFIGIPLVVASLYTSRGFGTAELMRLGWTDLPEIPRPRWSSTPPNAGFWRSVFAPFVDLHYWLYFLHSAIVSLVLTIVTWSLTIAWVSVTAGGLTYWIWGRFADGDRGGIWINEVVLDWIMPGNPWNLANPVAETLFWFVIGLLFALALPYVLRALTAVHWGAARLMLGRWESEELREEVVRLDASRGAAIRAEDAALRRLERDIHDGPQQRLIRLQMDLAAVERRLETDPAAARTLLGEARLQTTEALEELRALSRGVAPPLLQDRGLAVALDALAARSAVPVIVDQRARAAALPPAIERNAYFIVAELLTNAGKHSVASGVRLTTATRTDEFGRSWLDLWVGDNGDGGATSVPGHGLDGLSERVAGLGGVLVVDSPIGGPTNIGAHLPIAVAGATGAGSASGSMGA